MKKISLPDGTVAIVSDVDYEYLSQYSWSKDTNGYARCSVRHVTTYGQKTMSMHRMVMFHLEDIKLKQVDHINGNILDNRRENLRVCTAKQNARNNGRTKRLHSQYKGVTWHKKSGKWQAQIMLDGKNKHIGLHSDELEAAKAYDKKAQELHGEFSNRNFST